MYKNKKVAKAKQKLHICKKTEKMKNKENISITLHKETLKNLDHIIKKHGTNRSTYIETMLNEKTDEEKNENIKKTFDAFVEVYELIYDTVKTMKPASKEIINEMQKLSNIAKIFLSYMKKIGYDYNNQ